MSVTLLSVVPRHGQSHPPTLALLRGLPLRDGALATTVAHDSHNLIVAGRTPEDMAVAVRAVARMGGGVALVVGGAVVATVRLPVAGLMSDAPVEAIAAEVRAFNVRAAGARSRWRVARARHLQPRPARRPLRPHHRSRRRGYAHAAIHPDGRGVKNALGTGAKLSMILFEVRAR